MLTDELVCSGRTGHVEVYDLTFEGDEGTYEALVRHFFTFHDPTTLDRQGRYSIILNLIQLHYVNFRE